MRALLAAILACAAAAPALAGEVHTVVIDGMQFAPATLEVHAGDTVVWQNRDPFPHTATSTKRGFDSRAIPAGGSWKFVARRKGEFDYLCTLHTTMKGTLVVK
jgi:plastocyanin